MDGTIMTYNGNCRQLEMLKKHMNTITNNLQFTLETELNNKINFLDLTLTKINNKINYNIYRKPTITDHAIPVSYTHLDVYKRQVHRQEIL